MKPTMLVLVLAGLGGILIVGLAMFFFRKAVKRFNYRHGEPESAYHDPTVNAEEEV